MKQPSKAAWLLSHSPMDFTPSNRVAPETYISFTIASFKLALDKFRLF